MYLQPPPPTLFPYTTLFRFIHTGAARNIRCRMQDKRRRTKLFSPSGANGPRHPPAMNVASNGGIHRPEEEVDRKSKRVNSSHVVTSYAVFCLKKQGKDVVIV